MRVFVLRGAGVSAESGLSAFPALEIDLAAADDAGSFDDARCGRATEAVPARVDDLPGGLT